MRWSNILPNKCTALLSVFPILLCKYTNIQNYKHYWSVSKFIEHIVPITWCVNELLYRRYVDWGRLQMIDNDTWYIRNLDKKYTEIILEFCWKNYLFLKIINNKFLVFTYSVNFVETSFYFYANYFNIR